MRRILIYENTQWAVSTKGLESLYTGNRIEGDRLFEDRSNDYCWHQHFAEKDWCDIELFIPAFRVAAYVFKRDQFTSDELISMEQKGRRGFRLMVLSLLAIRTPGLTSKVFLDMKDLKLMEQRAMQLDMVVSDATLREVFDAHLARLMMRRKKR